MTTNLENNNSYNTPARVYAKGIGDAVADRTINRKLENGKREVWADVAKRVALGNSLLQPGSLDKQNEEFEKMHHHLRQASILMSGRHLQHGDETQLTRPQEVFTNCSTSASTFLSFYLLLNGSGVGRSYDDAMMVADYRNLPLVIPVIDMSHDDCRSGEINIPDKRSCLHLYSNKEVVEFEVEDSREGWAKAIEVMETMAFENVHRNKVLLIDFSKVRPRGSPIAGMQNRPASGPGPIISAVKNIAGLRDAEMAPWRSTMYADHYSAECVLVGGARRAARMATKSWTDESVLDFIQVKRGGFLWSSNNSVMVDADFWSGVKKVEEAISIMATKDPILLQNLLNTLVEKEVLTYKDLHAFAVFVAICEASYFDQTGEPGLINADRLEWKNENAEVLFEGDFAESERYKLSEPAKKLNSALAKVWQKSRFKAIVNPCGEVVINMLGGYCVIADVVPYHAAAKYRKDGRHSETNKKLEWDKDAEDSFRTATRALIRTNLMDCLYGKEVKRTNRIGVGITGLHEYAWSRFGYGWKDIIDESTSLDFWKTMSVFSNACVDEARKYSEELGVVMPHTVTTIKPAGTTSKIFGLTEGAHLPSMREYLRWVQFRSDDPLIAEYEKKGYPVKKLRTYNGTTIVGFPTAPTICTLGMGEKLITAAEATPEEQYQYLRLMEKYWIGGYKEGVGCHEYGNQVSYTLKYSPDRVSFAEFRKTLLEGQSTIKCCSVMPQTDTTAYEYQPEQPVTKHEFEQIAAAIMEEAEKEDVGFEHVDCSSGACPIDFNRN